jgi:hypothetical protein
MKVNSVHILMVPDMVVVMAALFSMNVSLFNIICILSFFPIAMSSVCMLVEEEQADNVD